MMEIAHLFYEATESAESLLDRLGSNTLLKDDLIKVRVKTNWLARWDDFRTTNWLEIIDYPELTMQQTQKFLTVTA